MRELVLESSRGRFTGLGDRNPGGRPLLALHGWLDNAASFVPLAPYLRGFDLVALDMAGHGKSPHYPAAAEYSLFNGVLDVLDIAERLGWARFSVLGHSLGGALASMLAAIAPDRIASLHLVEALGPLSGAEEMTVQRLREALAGRRNFGSKRKRVFPDPALAVQARLQSQENGLDETSAALLVARGIRSVPGGFEWSSDARLTLPTPLRMSEAQVCACLRAIECPVHLVVADPPPIYFPEALRQARLECLRELRWRSLPGGHYLHMSQPRAVAEALDLIRAQADGLP